MQVDGMQMKLACEGEDLRLKLIEEETDSGTLKSGTELSEVALDSILILQEMLLREAPILDTVVSPYCTSARHRVRELKQLAVKFLAGTADVTGEEHQTWKTSVLG